MAKDTAKNQPAKKSSDSRTTKRLELRISIPRLRFRWLLATIVTAVLVATVVMLVPRWQNERNLRQALPETIQRQANFPLYAPGKLPGGFAVSKEPSRFGSGVVTMALTGPDNKRMVISQQAKPSGFDFDKYHKENIIVRRQYDSPLGPVTIGAFHGQPAASLLADKTWVIVNGLGGVEDSQLAQVIDHLQPASR